MPCCFMNRFLYLRVLLIPFVLVQPFSNPKALPRLIQEPSLLRLSSVAPEKKHRNVIRIYSDYASRLWHETNPQVRKAISNDKVGATIRDLQHMIQDVEILDHSVLSEESKAELVDSCGRVLRAMQALKVKEPIVEQQRPPMENELVVVDEKLQQQQPKRRRSISFGAFIGLAVAAWVFSGNYIFTGLFTLMTVLGQLEYYRMVMNTGVYPARRISVIGACSMFLTALLVPDLHQICLPFFGCWAMIWFLTMKRTITTIPEVATTFTGMFYLGYVPSFWVRLRALGAYPTPTRIAPIVRPMLKFFEAKKQILPSFIPQAIWLPITSGSIFIFWTWISLAFADVAAYFVGRSFGKTKLGKAFPAAGATSPNKTVEGVLGGCAAAAAFSVFGAWVQRWPKWGLTGTLHGVMLALLGLVGDLTASMMKRDAGLKDFGDILPEHGGILDRVDSFIWTAPYSWLFFVYLLPAFRGLAASR